MLGASAALLLRQCRNIEGSMHVCTKSAGFEACACISRSSLPKVTKTRAMLDSSCQFMLTHAR
jgi:hypothetical protein